MIVEDEEGAGDAGGAAAGAIPSSQYAPPSTTSVAAIRSPTAARASASAGPRTGKDIVIAPNTWIEIKGSNSFYDDDLASLMTMIQQGRIKPVIDKVLPLDQAVEGLRLIQDRKVIGKVVVTP